MTGRIVGIDLGTSNTACAWAPIAAEAKSEILGIAQLVGAGRVEKRSLYPSCLFCPPDAERVDDPWGESPWTSGVHARSRGAEVPGRVVTSAKSWLCHPNVDRAAPILPFGATDASVARISPEGASALYLRHVRHACTEEIGALGPDDRVVLTVPASFDDAARSFTLRAARAAGLDPILLEEPTAAFYAYLEDPRVLEELARERGAVTILVCDVGGGTTDLSLLRAEKDGAGLRVERTAVGRHLLLGGDNMDLALAHFAEPRLSPEAKLPPGQFAQLVASCRAAKEILLAHDAPTSAEVRVVLPGAKLVGGILRATIEKGEVAHIVLDGFFRKDETAPPPRSGLVGFGLPYEADPAVTRHVLRFLERHDARTTVDAVLLNGGVFLAAQIADRMCDWLRALAGKDVVRLPLGDPDVAVARGAVVYGLARAGFRRSIEARSVRSYYIGIAADKPSAVCILPRGAREGDEQPVPRHTFDLAVGSPARFDLYARDTGSEAIGDIVSTGDLERLPPLATALDYTDARRASESVRVTLAAELAPTGVLAVRCREEGGARQFDLDFDLRPPKSPSHAPSAPPPSQRGHHEALSAIERVFGKTASESRAAKDLNLELERLCGERSSWDVSLLRAFFDTATRVPGARRRSLDHERTFFALAGYCVRPGFGDPGDVARCDLLERLFTERLGFPTEARGWQQFFVAYRRAAGGLDDDAQAMIRNALDPFVAPKEAGLVAPKKLVPLAMTELVELVASLERVPREGRALLGEWLVEKTYGKPQPHLWAAIGRVGARVPTYGSVHHVVAPSVVEAWIEVLLRQPWDKLPTAPAAAVRMARVTGDRSREISERTRIAVEKRLAAVHADALIPRLHEAKENDDERAEAFGDRLPLGLRLA